MNTQSHDPLPDAKFNKNSGQELESQVIFEAKRPVPTLRFCK